MANKRKKKKKLREPKLTLNDVLELQYKGLFLQVGEELKLGGNKFASNVLAYYVHFQKNQDSELAERNFLLAVEDYLRDRRIREQQAFFEGAVTLPPNLLEKINSIK